MRTEVLQPKGSCDAPYDSLRPLAISAVQLCLNSEINALSEALASPKSIRALSLKNRWFSIPAKPGAIDRLSTSTVLALALGHSDLLPRLNCAKTDRARFGSRVDPRTGRDGLLFPIGRLWT